MLRRINDMNKVIEAACMKSLTMKHGRPMIICSSEENAIATRKKFASQLAAHPKVSVTSFEELRRKKAEKRRL